MPRTQLPRARCLVLPGVGHCAALIAALDARGLRQPLLNAIASGASFLGICLGLQALYEQVRKPRNGRPWYSRREKLRGSRKLVKLPHMGWNTLAFVVPVACSWWFLPNDYFYFAHSLCGAFASGGSAAICEHGREFSPSWKKIIFSRCSSIRKKAARPARKSRRISCEAG